jgi:hypothetical protein
MLTRVRFMVVLGPCWKYQDSTLNEAMTTSFDTVPISILTNHSVIQSYIFEAIESVIK